MPTPVCRWQAVALFVLAMSPAGVPSGAAAVGKGSAGASAVTSSAAAADPNGLNALVAEAGPSAASAVEALRRDDWAAASASAGELLESGEHQALALALLAAAGEGTGDADGAACRWRAALSMDGRLRDSGMAQLGSAGKLLAAMPEEPDATEITGRTSSGTIDEALRKQIVRPAKLEGVSPHYNERARQARVVGVVIIDSIVGTNGRLQSARVLKGMPLGLDGMTVDGICDWRFRPASLKGEPVAVHYTLTLNFQVQGGKAAAAPAQPPG